MAKVYYPECRIVIQAYFENFGITREQTAFDAIPKSISIVRNSYRQADSWSVTFDAKDFPIPPALVRTAAVTVYLYDKKGLLEPKESIRERTINKPMITGLVDKVESRYDPSGREVTMTGQDYTALFLEHDFPKRRNFTGQRLDRVIDALLAEVDVTGAMTLRTQALEEFPIVGKSAGRTNKKGVPVKKGTNYWDFMYKLAISHGYLLYVRGTDLYLVAPKSVIGNETQDPDLGTKVFQLGWGSSVEQVMLDRKLGRERVPQIEVVSYDPYSRKRVTARFPEKNHKVTVGVGTKRNERIQVPLRGITEKKVLAQVAELQYLLLAQGEQTMQINTRELVDDAVQDLLFLESGDSLYLAFDPFNREELKKQPLGSRVEWLMLRGFTSSAATFMVEHLDRLDTFSRPFFVREAQFDWDGEDGLTIQASLCNFVIPEGRQAETGDVTGAAEAIR